MKKPILLSLILDKLFLKAFRLGASTVRWSSRFNLLTTLFETKCLVTSLVHRVFLSFKQWPLVPFIVSSNDKRVCVRLKGWSCWGFLIIISFFTSVNLAHKYLSFRTIMTSIYVANNRRRQAVWCRFARPSVVR